MIRTVTVAILCILSLARSNAAEWAATTKTGIGVACPRIAAGAHRAGIAGGATIA